MSCELVQVVHLKSKMRQIGADHYRPALIKFANLDFFVAAGGFQKDELGAAPGCLTSNLFQSENVLVKRDGRWQVVSHQTTIIYVPPVSTPTPKP